MLKTAESGRRGRRRGDAGGGGRGGRAGARPRRSTTRTPRIGPVWPSSEIGPAAAPAVEKLGAQLGSDEDRKRAWRPWWRVARDRSRRPNRWPAKIAELLDTGRYGRASGMRRPMPWERIGDRDAGPTRLTPSAWTSKDEFLRVTAAWAYVRLVENEKSPALQKAVQARGGWHRVAGPSRARRGACGPLRIRICRGSNCVPRFAGQCCSASEIREKLMEMVDALAIARPRVVPMCIRSLEEERSAAANLRLAAADQDWPGRGAGRSGPDGDAGRFRSRNCGASRSLRSARSARRPREATRARSCRS